jgi:AcrR family transcriptional regulator
MQAPKLKQAPVNERVIPASSKPRVRDRIFETACELFYRHGIRAVGVDTIATEAGTNKMSFYRSFGSKDELVAEYLREQEHDAWQWWDQTIAPHAGNPRAQVEALFQTMSEKTCEDDFRGCALANAAVEIHEDNHPVRAVVEHFKGEMRQRFRKLARDMRALDAEALGDALMLLWEGSYLSRLTFRADQGPARHAPKAAQSLMRAFAG